MMANYEIVEFIALMQRLTNLWISSESAGHKQRKLKENLGYILFLISKLTGFEF